MGDVTPINGGFRVTNARYLIAHVAMSPKNNLPNGAVFTIKFDRGLTTGQNMINGVLTFGSYWCSTAVDKIIGAETPLPMVFPGRRAFIKVTDSGSIRTLQIRVKTLDGQGTNENWDQTLQIVRQPGVTGDFDVLAGINSVITSVDSPDV
jgi:hypothetical protein